MTYSEGRDSICSMNVLLPKTVSAKEIQRNYRKIFDLAKSGGDPIVVLTNNKPDVAIDGIDEMEKLFKKAQKAELEGAAQATRAYRREKRQKKLKKLISLKQLM